MLMKKTLIASLLTMSFIVAACGQTREDRAGNLANDMSAIFDKTVVLMEKSNQPEAVVDSIKKSKPDISAMKSKFAQMSDSELDLFEEFVPLTNSLLNDLNALSAEDLSPQGSTANPRVQAILEKHMPRIMCLAAKANAELRTEIEKLFPGNF